MKLKLNWMPDPERGTDMEKLRYQEWMDYIDQKAIPATSWARELRNYPISDYPEIPLDLYQKEAEERYMQAVSNVIRLCDVYKLEIGLPV